MAAKEWVRPSEFQSRLQIDKSTFRDCRKKGQLTEKKTHGITLVEWGASRKRLIEGARTPTRYRKAEIEKRRKLNEKKQNGKKLPAKAAIKKASLKKNTKKTDKDPAGKSGKDSDIDEDETLAAGKSKLEAEAIKQSYLAKSAKLKYLKDSGDLIEVSVVSEEWEKIALQFKQLVMAIPNRVSELFASMKDSRKIQKNLTGELTKCLSSLKYDTGKNDD